MSNDAWRVRDDLVPVGVGPAAGVGPVTALAFKATIDDPARFRRSSDVGAHLGLTPGQYQSRETDVRGPISRSGDAFTRTALFTASHVGTITAGGGPDAFVHISAVERSGMREITEGQKIGYDMERDSKSGKMSACNLQAA